MNWTRIFADKTIKERNYIAGSILQIEPKRLDSGYKPEPTKITWILHNDK